MRKRGVILILCLVMAYAFIPNSHDTPYTRLYRSRLDTFNLRLSSLVQTIKQNDPKSAQGRAAIQQAIEQARFSLKNIDIWLRYLEPVMYNKINAPIPVEWENEVFEKFEKPYRREGAGLMLAYLYMGQNDAQKDSLITLITQAQTAMQTFAADSITRQLDSPAHFFFANRLYLLNLAAIYTTGFECPDTAMIIPEMCSMLRGVRQLYTAFNASFPGTPITTDYLALYDKTIEFAAKQPGNYARFDHYTFIRDYINPLFALNQKMINQYGVVSISYNDYTLNNNSLSIFDKSLYTPQNTKGIYSLVTDSEQLAEIRHIGKLLFYDPILSGNNKRSCASCHKPKQYFTDTVLNTSMQFNNTDKLPRNTPSLVNVIYNHLLMLDGRHISLQNQGLDVMTNPVEMGGKKQDIVDKVMSCKEYRTALKKFAKLTPEVKGVTFEHIVSAITYYYGDYSKYYAPFDDAMNDHKPLDKEAIAGFNLFMGKALCGTCHYVPQFNGVKPPYISSEFEVIGAPADSAYSALSNDSGRFRINPAFETMHAFRTGTIRNAEYTKPYMHNGSFYSLDQVLEFYNNGGGVGRKFKLDNQTLPTDAIHLTSEEKKQLLAFIHSLNEKIIFEPTPEKLPESSDKALNARKVGGEY
jgi:cytochrome c peroxidase